MSLMSGTNLKSDGRSNPVPRENFCQVLEQVQQSREKSQKLTQLYFSFEERVLDYVFVDNPDFKPVQIGLKTMELMLSPSRYSGGKDYENTDEQLAMEKGKTRWETLKTKLGWMEKDDMKALGNLEYYAWGYNNRRYGLEELKEALDVVRKERRLPKFDLVSFERFIKLYEILLKLPV